MAFHFGTPEIAGLDVTSEPCARVPPGLHLLMTFVFITQMLG